MCPDDFIPLKLKPEICVIVNIRCLSARRERGEGCDGCAEEVKCHHVSD
jgi:hypothetical protein